MSGAAVFGLGAIALLVSMALENNRRRKLALIELLRLLEDTQAALAIALPTGEFGPVIELLDGPRQRQVQSRAEQSA